MAGHELATEGFQPGQVGSSAMPHKMNTRSLRADQRAATPSSAATWRWSRALAGDQWNEGDVCCSVVRRVALPDAFFAADGLFETFLTVLDDFGAYPAVIDRELRRYLPFLATTKVLMAAVRAGVGREAAHEAIKEHAVAVALEMREKGSEGNDLLDRLAADDRLGLDPTTSPGVVAEPLRSSAPRRRRSAAFVAQVEAVVARPTPSRGLRARPDPVVHRAGSSALARFSGDDRDQPPAPLLRQGPRHLRRRRRPAADGHLRPALRLRRRAWPSRSPTRAGCSPPCRRSGSSSWPTSCPAAT